MLVLAENRVIVAALALRRLIFFPKLEYEAREPIFSGRLGIHEGPFFLQAHHSRELTWNVV